LASVVVAERIVREEGATLAHSTNNPQVIAGAGTLSLSDRAGAGSTRW
jgi:threonine dehydratase